MEALGLQPVLGMRALHVDAFRAAIRTGKLPVDEDGATGLLAAGAQLIGRDEAIDDRGGFLRDEEEPGAGADLRWWIDLVPGPGQAVDGAGGACAGETDQNTRGKEKATSGAARMGIRNSSAWPWAARQFRTSVRGEVAVPTPTRALGYVNSRRQRIVPA
nr:hypothetical protein [Roseomonas harenae]